MTDLTAQRPRAGDLANLGLAYMLLSEHEQALESFQIASRKIPGNAMLTLNLADATLLAGRQQEALDLYRRVIELADNDPAGKEWQFLTVKAQAHAHLGEGRQAVAVILEAIRLAPENPQVGLEAALV